MRKVTGYALVYVIWILTSALGVLALLATREAAMTTFTIGMSRRLAANPTQEFSINQLIRVAEQWSYLFAGLIALVLIVYTEYYYRAGYQAGHLLRGFCLMTALQAGLVWLAHIVRFSVARAAGLYPWSAIYIPVIELVVTGLFIWLYARQLKAPVHQ